jgi:asparagine synthase (glutamine-hydrolysing)
MCGITGFYCFGSNKISAESLQVMTQTLSYRGPDDNGCAVFPSNWDAPNLFTDTETLAKSKSGQVGLGHRRLSILDLSKLGHQPMSRANEKVWMVFNGEIYNYIEIREELEAKGYQFTTNTDTEVVLNSYLEWDKECFNRFNGMWAMAIYDRRSDIMILSRDRFGQKPLFYFNTGKEVFFASELKSIQAIVPLEPDKSKIALNLSCWFMIQPLTLYKNLFNVNPGSYLELKGKKSVQEVRWYKPHIKVQNQGFEEIKEKMLKLYRDSITLRMRSDVPVGIFLSGGLDSTSQAYLANEVSMEKITAFTSNIVGKEKISNNNTDVEIPRRLCEDLGLKMSETSLDFNYYDKNIVKIIRHYDEIFVNSGVLVFYALSSAAKSVGVKVVFTGVGGDEAFGGYPWQAKFRLFPKLLMYRSLEQPTRNYVSRLQRKLLIMGKYSKYLHKLASAYKLAMQSRLWHAQSLASYFPKWMADCNQNVSETIDMYSKEYFNFAISSIDNDLYNQFNFANVFTTIGSQNYMVDMGCMMNSVENRSPLLDYRLFEYMMSVPDEIKIKYGQKGLLRQILTEFMPTYVTVAKKSGPTMPLDIWFNNPDLKRDIISFVKKNLSLIAEFVSEDLSHEIKKQPSLLFANQSIPLFAVLSFIIWAKQRIENSILDDNITFTELIRS